MKKILLSSAAVAIGLAFAAPAANAQGVTLDLGGHMKGYVGYVDQDTVAGREEREIDIFRETEIHFTGETVLDNGLTVGFHAEADADGADSFTLDESYAYFSGSWGRVNFGEEDGAAYLLQVAAPSADSNIDGLRQYINPVNYDVALGTTTGTFATAVGAGAGSFGFDYSNDVGRNAEKLTYLTPVMNGFQGGVSYTPDLNNFAPSSNSLFSTNEDDELGEIGSVYEIAARYEGQFDNVGFTFGGGYTHGDLEQSSAGGFTDDFQEWNVGLDIDVSAFGLGVAYTENNNGNDVTDTNETWVVGADYTTGPFKLGASYFNNENDALAGNDIETDRYTGGVVYTYGPGMTFRGSVSYIDHEIAGADDIDATSVLVGTQINF